MEKTNRKLTMKLTKTKLKQLIKEQLSSFNPTDEVKKDFMDPAIKELSETLKSEQLQHALENVAISVIDQYTDAEEYEDQEPGSREEKYGKMTADQAREEIALAIDAVFDDFLEDFFFGTVEQLISETFPDDDGGNSDEVYAQYTDEGPSTTLDHPTFKSHERMKQIARKTR